MDQPDKLSKFIKIQTPILRCLGSGSDFESGLYKAINKYVRVDNLTTWKIVDDKVEHLSTRGKLDVDTAEKLAASYYNLFHKDPAWQSLSTSLAKPKLWRMNDSQYKSLYKYYFFEQYSLIDKVAWAEEFDNGIYLSYFYRRKPAAKFNEVDIRTLEMLAPYITSLNATHFTLLKNLEALKFLEHKLTNRSFEESVKKLMVAKPSPLDRLTAREAEVCQHIMRGETIQDIAVNLSISANSVATYRQRAFKRLDISNCQGLFAILFDSQKMVD